MEMGKDIRVSMNLATVDWEINCVAERYSTAVNRLQRRLHIKGGCDEVVLATQRYATWADMVDKYYQHEQRIIEAEVSYKLFRLPAIIEEDDYVVLTSTTSSRMT